MTKDLTKIIVGCLIVFNMGLFFYANTRPIEWIQNETLLHRFFWSMDDISQFSLHTGLTPSDFVKPFQAEFVDGLFRARQVSYFIEMITFKFWQALEIGFVRNYSLIGLHVLNVFLLGVLVYRLTRSREASALSMIVLLNSSIALSTLLFPFRNAKLLVITFLLIAWLILTYSDKFYKAKRGQVFSFYAVLLLMLFTDEAAVAILPLPFLYLMFRDGLKDTFRPQIILGVVGLMTSFLILTYSFFKIYLALPEADPALIGYKSYFLDFLGRDFSYWHVLQDILNSFFNYFLAHNFGWWSFGGWGIISFLSFAILLGIGIVYRHSSLIKKLAISISFVLLFKAFFIHHNGGLHEILMPKGAIFPSLFFFNYYYPYPDIVLWVFMMGLLWENISQKKALFVLAACLITLINISNVIHWRDGLRTTLEFHKFDDPDKQQGIRNAMAIKKLVAAHTGPAYISFPTGPSDILKGRINDGDQFVLARIIPVMFLKSLEEGKMIISLKNTKPKKALIYDDELRNAKYFIDAGLSTQLTFDLEGFQKEYGLKALEPIKVSQDTVIKKLDINKVIPEDDIVFFIKGESSFIFTINDKKLAGEQIYGQSYQLFIYNLKSEMGGQSATVSLSLKPLKGTAFLVGPFVVKHSLYKINN